jgi:four helix bundle protein
MKDHMESELMEPVYVYDLEERLLEYAASIVKFTQAMGRDYAEAHIANRLISSGTAPLSFHGEARSCSSRKESTRKLSLGLRALRDSERWLRLIEKSELVPDSDGLESIQDETAQLIRIFVASIEASRKPHQ